MLLARASSIPKLTGSAELKFDGFRAIATVEKGRVRSLTGRGDGKLAARFRPLPPTWGPPSTPNASRSMAKSSRAQATSRASSCCYEAPGGAAPLSR